jgi:hypothetical protein
VIGIEKGVWGIRERARLLWGKVQPGDKVVFYAVRTGVLGYRNVEEQAEWLEVGAGLLFLASMGLNMAYNSMATMAYVGGPQPPSFLQPLAISLFILSIIIGGIARAEKKQAKA